MNSIVRNVVVPACVVALGAAAIVWNVETKRATERKFAEEVKQYQLGAQRGDANSEFELGRSYFWGRGVPQGFAQADYWYQKAADQGLAKAKYSIGNLYYYGNGVTQSYAEALVWYRKAADQGLSVAQFAIASMYYHGFGVQRSYPEAMLWDRKAADQGYARAESGIGYLYWSGLGVEKDRAEANRWYRRAASHGDKDAQRWLGLRFYSLRTWVKIPLAGGLVGGLLLISGLFSPRRLLHDQTQRKFVFAGVLCLVTFGGELYAHSEYCLFPSAWAATAYRFACLFLGGIMVTLLVTALIPRASKILLISSGVLFVTMAICLSAIARFDMRALSTIGWRFFVFSAFPLGMAISVAVHLWRRKREPADGASEPPATSGKVPDAV